MVLQKAEVASCRKLFSSNLPNDSRNLRLNHAKNSQSKTPALVLKSGCSILATFRSALLRAGSTNSIAPAFAEATAWQTRLFRPLGPPVHVARFPLAPLIRTACRLRPRTVDAVPLDLTDVISRREKFGYFRARVGSVVASVICASRRRFVE